MHLPNDAKIKFVSLFMFRFGDKEMPCLNFHFFDILTKAMESLKIDAHLRNSCRRLHIVHVSPTIVDVSFCIRKFWNHCICYFSFIASRPRGMIYCIN